MEEEYFDEEGDPVEGMIPCGECDGYQTWCDGCKMYTQTCCVEWGTCMCS